MHITRSSKVFVGVAILALTSAVAFADVKDKKTILTVKETVEIPGATLAPGEYEMKLIDMWANKHVVQVSNAKTNEVVSTVIAIPNSRLEVTGDTTFAWHETPVGQPPALKAWFYPGDNFGQEFAYPESRATELTTATTYKVAYIKHGEVESLVDATHSMAARFEESLDKALDKSIVDDTKAEESNNDRADDLEDHLNQAKDDVDEPDEFRKHLDSAMQAAFDVEKLMGQHRFSQDVTKDWELLRSNLNGLAGLYGLKPIAPMNASL